MNETETDQNLALLTAPIPLEQLPASVAKLVGATGVAKTMAARGIAPLKPHELAVAVYQLSFDADPAVSAAAQAAPGTLPDAVLVTLLKEPLPYRVLHFFGTRLPDQRAEAIEALLYNAQTPDATFVVLGGRLPERLVEIIVQNESRLLRMPAIVKALFGNRAARMSSVNRALELCARNGVSVDVPGFDEIVNEIRQNPSALDSASDQAFAAMAEAVAAPTDYVPPPPPEDFDDEEAQDTLGDPPPEEKVADSAASRSEAKPKPKVPEKKEDGKSLTIDFSKLKIYEKVRMAQFGNSYCRSQLIRDTNRLVAMAVIKSPMITDSEVISAAGNRGVHEEVIRYIANSRDYTKLYAIRWGLVNNPKCPLTVSIRFLTTLNKMDLKKMSKSKNVPGALSTTAKRLLATKQT
jgi:hypothetical protein